MQQLLLHDLWPKVRSFTRTARRVQAAIAYLSTDKYLRLKSGDVLVVDASHHAVSCGETSASTLQKLRRRGVVIFHYNNLHAKVVVADNKAVIGSANASASSAHTLFETAVLTTDPNLVSQTKSLLFQLQRHGSPLGAKELHKLSRIKVRRRRGTHTANTPARNKIRTPGKQFWFSAAVDLPDDAFPDEQSAVEQAERKLKSQHPELSPTCLRMTGASMFRLSASNGDLLHIASARKNNETPYEVAPAIPILLVQRRNHWTRFYYDPENAYPLKPVSWHKFKQLLKKANVRSRIGKNSICTLHASDAMALERQWPRTKN
ncbi:MAG TPA: phospholipase D-like domain-containing protein [Candidatus Dormibacteraeota bacterium]|nr:phospholipase D-like domain-containing protein [Candidatus Dormibacteraeota bacterium]